MRSPGELRKLVGDYESLIAAKKTRSLSDDEARALEVLREAILDEGAKLEAGARTILRKSPRVRLALTVAFSSNDAATAFTRDIGTGGLSVITNQPLPKGTVLHLQMGVPGWPAPLATTGEVVWSEQNAMGIAFRDLQPEAVTQLKALISESTSFLKRVRGSLAAPSASIEAEVALKIPVLIVVTDKPMAEAIVARLASTGLLGIEVASPGLNPVVLVADPQHVKPTVERYPSALLVLVNASEGDAVAAKLSGLRPVAVVRPPATAEQVVAAIERLFPS